MIVATGSSVGGQESILGCRHGPYRGDAPPASAEINSGSMVGCPRCLKPRGTSCRILIGYLPEADRRCRVYSQDANVKTMITNALRKTEKKKKNRASTRPVSDGRSIAAGQHAHLCEGTSSIATGRPRG